MSRKFAFSIALLPVAVSPIANYSQAAIGEGTIGAPLISVESAPIEQTQFVFDDQNYCWYDDGWQGPGWDWCGYAWDEGIGWGGGYGWNGWRGGGSRAREPGQRSGARGGQIRQRNSKPGRRPRRAIGRPPRQPSGGAISGHLSGAMGGFMGGGHASGGGLTGGAAVEWVAAEAVAAVMAAVVAMAAAVDGDQHLAQPVCRRRHERRRDVTKSANPLSRRKRKYLGIASAAASTGNPLGEKDMPKSLTVVSAKSGLDHYLSEIRRFPILAPQEEYMLAKRRREHEDATAAQKLITSHLRLVAKIAMGYRGYGLPVGELVSEGNVGLYASGQALRARTRLPPRHLRDVVDQSVDSGICPAILVAR